MLTMTHFAVYFVHEIFHALTGGVKTNFFAGDFSPELMIESELKPAAIESDPRAINDNGDVLGIGTIDDVYHTYFYGNGKVIDILARSIIRFPNLKPLYNDMVRRGIYNNDD